MIVSNSTPLINFAAIGRLDILEALFQKVFIPRAVEYELLERGLSTVLEKEMEKMTELKMNIPEDILYTLNETKDAFIKKMKLYAAMELYKSQKLSMGKASELAEMNKIDFMFELGKHEIPAINYDADDFKEETEWIMEE